MPARDIAELDAFLNQWTDSENLAKQAFVQLLEHLEQKEGVRFEFVPREGLTYSLRASHPGQKARPLFAMIDVIEDDPRWLSVCFFGEMITDPEEKGDMVPEGLLGEDAHCFDLEVFDEADVAYVAARLDEAHKRAANG
jgi:hypothetical protein